MEIFNTLTKVFPFRADGDEARDISRAYFKTLQKYPLALVKVGADNCIASLEKFPKPLEWAKRIPKIMPGPDLPRLTVNEESEWRDAERRGYEGACCTCRACIELGANALPTRFVPLDPEERALMGDRQVLRGEWIHGEPLVRWYFAREEFWTKFSSSRFADTKVPPSLEKKSFHTRIEQIFSAKSKRELRESVKEWMPYRENREPGEDG